MGKINVAELLRNCPKGMELDCTIWDNVTFECVDDREEFSIIIRLSDGCREAVTDYGCYSDNDGAKCVIFPKGKTSWEGFVPPCKFKDGDILTTNIGSIFIFSHLELDSISDRSICKAYVGIRDTMPISLFHTEQSDIFGPYESMCKLASEEEKAKLFDAIKDNGYKWNEETKTLEKLSKFKVGDRIILKDNPHNMPSIRIKAVTKSQYILENEGFLYINSTDEKYVLENKFNITTLKPFDKVLVRGDTGQKWTHDFFGFMDKDKGYPFVCVGHYVIQCIPYEGNEHLLGTTDDCDEYFKTLK